MGVGDRGLSAWRPVSRLRSAPCRTDGPGQRVYLWIRGQDPDRASPESGNRPKGPPHGGPFFLGMFHPEVQGEAGREPRPAEAAASDHRHRGARGALQLAGHLVGLGQGHVTELLHRLAAAAHGDRDAHMRVHLVLIGPEVEHHGTDFAAEGGADRHREWGEEPRLQARCRHGGKGSAAPRGAPCRQTAWPDPCCCGGAGQRGEAGAVLPGRGEPEAVGVA